MNDPTPKVISNPYCAHLTEGAGDGGSDNNDVSIPYRKILLNKRIMYGSPMFGMTGYCWAGLDPILAPELLDKVFRKKS